MPTSAVQAYRRLRGTSWLRTCFKRHGSVGGRVLLSIAERQAIHRGTHTSVRDLNAQLRTYIDGWNGRAYPFTRTKAPPRQGQP